MRLDQLINELRGKDQPDEIPVRTLARLSETASSKSSWFRWTSEPGPEDLIPTPWGGTAVLRSVVDPENVIGIAHALRCPPRTVWLAVGESLGLPGMFIDPAADAAAKLPTGWHTLTEARLALLRRLAVALVDDQRRENDLTTLRDERDALAARVTELEAAPGPVKPPVRRRRTTP